MDESQKRKIIWDSQRRKKLSGNSAASILNSNGKHSTLALLKFKSLLASQDPVIRAAAIDSLIEIGSIDAANIIQRSINDTSPEVRAKACYGLGQLRHHSAKNELYDSLQDNILMVVCEAAVALSQLGDKAGYTRIVHLMKIPGKHRAETIRALSRITKQRFAKGKQGIAEALRWIKKRERIGA